MKQQEKAYKDVVQEARKIHKTGQEKDGVLEKHKERNRLILGTSLNDKKTSKKKLMIQELNNSRHSGLFP